MIAMNDAVVNGSPEANRRAILAEVGFTNVTPSVFTQLYPRNAADLWLPMSADHDTEFNILAPAPKDANSVLGLLLRNSALRIAANATNEFAGLGSRAARRSRSRGRRPPCRSRTCRPPPDARRECFPGLPPRRPSSRRRRRRPGRARMSPARPSRSTTASPTSSATR